MAIPNGYTLLSWFYQIVGELNTVTDKLRVYTTDWPDLPSPVKAGIKTRTLADIDTAITRLTELKTDIEAITD